jgi:hypothetical protein
MHGATPDVTPTGEILMTFCALMLLALPLLASLAYLLGVAIQVDHLEREAEHRQRREAATPGRSVLPLVRVELPAMPLMRPPEPVTLPVPATTSLGSSAWWPAHAHASSLHHRQQQAVLQRRESMN